ncbi:FkbM family methyltransferase [Lentzea tibetensis]|nr:FkbM family methyltransferase [Lentzea tibetensis]
MSTLVQVRDEFCCYTTSDFNHQGLTQAHFTYEEIFELRTYLRHGVRLAPDAVVLDVGANIGLFSLFVKQECPSARVLAFEPMPAVVEALRRNLDLHGVPDVEVHALALGARREEAVFTYHPALSCNSTNRPEGKELLLEMQRVLFGEHAAGSEEVRVDVDTLSAVLERRSDLDRIDLLKIDVEGAELDVLRGVGAANWPRVDQVVVEVHDRDGRLADVLALLGAQGFRTSSQASSLLTESADLREAGAEDVPPGDYLVYATRPR